MPVYDKPMIYYPLSTLLCAHIKDILIITTPTDQQAFQNVLGDGRQWGIKLQYATQAKPEGIAQSLMIARDFIGADSVALILGDNLFYGENLSEHLHKASQQTSGATVFGYWVDDPQRYGVVAFDKNATAISIDEKPDKPASNYAVTGLYFYDNKAVDMVDRLKPSPRGELEITDLNKLYLEQKQLKVVKLGRGTAWLDTGTHDSLIDAGNFIRIIEKRQGQKIGCIEEIAYRQGFITRTQLQALAAQLNTNPYGAYLTKILQLEKEEFL